MEIPELRQIAERARNTKETGIALIIASAILALFLFIPLTPAQEAAPAETATVPEAPDAFADLPVEAKAAIVYDLTTGETLYAKNADAQLPLASLTKLLTVYAALEHFSPATPIAISEDAVRMEAPRAFNEGQVFSLADLSRLTLVASLNDGAAAIAEATAARESRSQPEMLASAAAALGLSQTYAVNGSGLDVNAAISGGYGSAYDLARLSGALFKKAPEIARATAEPTAEAVSEGGTRFSVKNTDPIVGSIPGLMLSKTGLTDLAGGNLSLVFDVGVNHPVAVVVLGSSKQSRFTDGTLLVAATFAHFAGVKSL